MRGWAAHVKVLSHHCIGEGWADALVPMCPHNYAQVCKKEGGASTTSQCVLAFPPGCTTRWPWPLRARCSGAGRGSGRMPDAATVDRLAAALREKRIGVVAHFYMDPQVRRRGSAGAAAAAGRLRAGAR